MYEPSEQTSALLRVHNRRANGTSTLFQQGLADFQNGGPNPVEKDKVDFFSDNNNDQINNQRGIALTINYDTDNFTFTSISAYDEADLFSEGEFHPGRQIRALDLNDVSQITQELRLSSNADTGLEWQTGMYYFSEDLSYNNFNHDSDGDFFSVIDPGNTLLQTATQDTNGWAVFGNIGYQISDSLKLTAGARYTEEDKDFQQAVSVFVPDPLDYLNFVNRPIQRIDDSATGAISTSGDEITWELSLAYALSDDINLFGRVAKGFRAPSIAGNQQSNAFNLGNSASLLAAADAETVTSYEFGAKTELLNGRMRFNATAFLWDFEDMQLFFQGAGGLVSLSNATGGEGMGVELEIEFHPTDNLNIKVAHGFTDAEFEGDELVGGSPIGGNEVDNAPKNTLNLIVNYVVPLEFGELFIGTDWSYRDERYFTPINNDSFKGDAYWLGGLRAGMRTEPGNFEVATWVRNMTDTEELDGALGFIDAGIMTGPRTYGVDLTFRF